MGELFWLNDRQWAAIEPLLPRLGGKPQVDDRKVISGILHRYREGLLWRTPSAAKRSRRLRTLRGLVPSAAATAATVQPTAGRSTISIRLCGVVRAFSSASIRGSGLAVVPERAVPRARHS
jgi:transposase